MINKPSRHAATWSVSEATALLDALLDASAAGVAQTIERNGVKFLVTRQNSETGSAREHLLAGGPLEEGDLSD